MEVNKFGKKLILFIIFFVVFLVMFGHYTNNQSLTSFGTEKVTMKFVTAFLFLLSGISLMINKKWVSISIIVTCIYVVSSWLINESKPLFLPIFEGVDAIRSIHGDVPSWMTIVTFLLFATAELTEKLSIYKLVGLQAIVAVVGHALDIPFMFNYMEGISTGMAFNTSILFFHLAAYRLVKDKGVIQLEPIDRLKNKLQ